MSELRQFIGQIIDVQPMKLIISNPVSKTEEYKKITAEKKGGGYQIAKYTDKQVFHENLSPEAAKDRLSELIDGHYKQVNASAVGEEHILLISKKGKCTYKRRKLANERIRAGAGDRTQECRGTKESVQTAESHNRKKNYILSEGMEIAPLVDMGIFTADGRIVNSMYDKYKQINRFIEIINDEIEGKGIERLNVIDFGCGKSYLTFVVYYYLTYVMHIEAHMIGLDLKADVIEKCNKAAQKYGYEDLHFEMGDINGYKTPFDVDMVITLHACDTATDYALFNAISWKAKMIFSVPCCQHELNRQMKPDSLKILSRYGIIKERFAALATDAVRGNLLEYCGYKTQLLEFIDFDHTPKNILIRAVRRPLTPKSVKVKALAEVRALMDQFSFKPTLYQLLDMESRD